MKVNIVLLINLSVFSIYCVAEIIGCSKCIVNNIDETKQMCIQEGLSMGGNDNTFCCGPGEWGKPNYHSFNDFCLMKNGNLINN